MFKDLKFAFDERTLEIRFILPKHVHCLSLPTTSEPTLLIFHPSFSTILPRFVRFYDNWSWKEASPEWIQMGQRKYRSLMYLTNFMVNKPASRRKSLTDRYLHKDEKSACPDLREIVLKFNFFEVQGLLYCLEVQSYISRKMWQQRIFELEKLFQKYR